MPNVHFDAIVDQKKKLREQILNNQDIVNLLVNTGNNVATFTNYATGGNSPAASLVKKHFYVPGTTVVDQNFITMRSRVVYTNSNVVKQVQLVVYVICNTDQIDLLQGSRADLIATKLDQIVNRTDNVFGMGGITLGSSEEVQFNSNYVGWEIPYVTYEFNRKAELL